MKTYVTKSGDAWDMIAKKVYGDEKHVSFLMKHNQKHLEEFIFSSGAVLEIPDLPEEIENNEFPDWRN